MARERWLGGGIAGGCFTWLAQSCSLGEEGMCGGLRTSYGRRNRGRMQGGGGGGAAQIIVSIRSQCLNEQDISWLLPLSKRLYAVMPSKDMQSITTVILKCMVKR